MEQEDKNNEPDSDADDLEGYFLEPTPCSTSMVEKIAEANRLLFESDAVPEDDEKPRKVQFSSQLVDFAPDEVIYSADENDSTSNRSAEEIKENEEDEGDQPLEEEDEVKEDLTDPTEEDKSHHGKESKEGNGQKLLLVLLPPEQSSSCESLVGEEEDNEEPEKKVTEEPKEKIEPKIRPKSANRGLKKGRTNNDKIECKLVCVSPDLNYFYDNSEKSWHESQNVKLRPKSGSKTLVESGPTETKWPISSCVDDKCPTFPILRPKTAPSKRPCCPNRTDLPKYNGLRSEYGLSAEQLQERKMKIATIRQQRRNEKLLRQKEELQKRIENEERFSNWLEQKSERQRCRSNHKKSLKTDTLVRSDVYIQKHAVYASKCGVSYAVNYPFEREKNKISDIRRKTVNLSKLLESISPHAQKTYEIHVRSSY